MEPKTKVEELHKCDRCKKNIYFKDRATLLRDYQGDDMIDEHRWHFDCYLQWFQDGINQKAMNLFNSAMNKALPQIATRITAQLS